ncbi:hypothetical protein DUI87_12846 [Hirundo rustica rustica]|uniref:Uncharacterized protein n=1 Tax=Hirundo rustica rustica TaxID=333673 RepID=A0A3M0KA49_HIRRU|nr:hypothetical protein DUI87_12846 [Hirundo rustica rustica]
MLCSETLKEEFDQFKYREDVYQSHVEQFGKHRGHSMYPFQMDITELTLGVADNFQLQMLINNVDSGPKPHLCDISEPKSQDCNNQEQRNQDKISKSSDYYMKAGKHELDRYFHREEGEEQRRIEK